MSLPNYLAKIKSAGVYRFVWDKSQVPPQAAETMRLVVGYSEKGPFNTPVYIESASDFISIYGNISKRLERKGVYFHRMALQALSAGPILALNLKPFEEETVEYINFNPSKIGSLSNEKNSVKVSEIYDTDRFWALDVDKFRAKLNTNNYITIAATDIKDNSCSIFIRKIVPDSYKGITLRSWYASQSIEYPEYLESILDTDMSDYFAEVYVFRGEIKPELYAVDGSLSKYLTVDGSVNAAYTDSFGDPADALDAMSRDSNSNFIGAYSGITLPYFKDANGNYISLDLKFNADHNSHKMLMKLEDSVLDEASDILSILKSDNPEDGVSSIIPIYINGYTYSTIDKKAGSVDIWNGIVSVLKEKGIRTALTNRVDVEYHYLIDTFDGEPTNAKKELFELAQAKDNTFAIVNFPKMSKFGNVNGVVKDFKPKMPSEVEGASYGAYYTQLTFSDGTVKTVVPSAALVSNLFMDKWGARQPYYIVAGPTFGRLSYLGMIGPDYNFGRSDLDILEPMGVNAIIYVPRKGTYINSNQTAKQVPVSGLSKIHIRELVIYLQNEVENLLQTYQWELNTQPLRDTIKSKADVICETILNNGGIYAYKNICNEHNNTQETIDNEMIILDTEIEPARGAGKMVHQLTIHKTGGLTSTVR